MHGLSESVENASIRSLLAKLKCRYVACGLTKITEYICCYNENTIRLYQKSKYVIKSNIIIIVVVIYKISETLCS